MSRLYNLCCALEARVREHRGSGGCGARSPSSRRICTGPPDHGGHAHVATGYGGRIIIMRWTDGGTIQEDLTIGWEELLP